MLFVLSKNKFFLRLSSTLIVVFQKEGFASQDLIGEIFQNFGRCTFLLKNLEYFLAFLNEMFVEMTLKNV